MNMSDISREIYDSHSLRKRDVDDVVKQVFDIISTCLEDGESVSIARFGTFEVAEVKPRKAQDFSGNTIDVPAKRVPKFRPSDVLKRKIESSGE